jgi:hypothetical protein
MPMTIQRAWEDHAAKDAMQLSMTLSLDGTAADLGRLGPDPAGATLRLTTAIAYLMGERDVQRAGVAYPNFRRAEDPADQREVELVIDAELWERFCREAERQGVSHERMLEHALFHLAADEDSGVFATRLEQR